MAQNKMTIQTKQCNGSINVKLQIHNSSSNKMTVQWKVKYQFKERMQVRTNYILNISKNIFDNIIKMFYTPR